MFVFNKKGISMSADIPNDLLKIYASKTCVSCFRIYELRQFSKIYSADGSVRYSDICTHCDRTGGTLGKEEQDKVLLNSLRSKGIDPHLNDEELLEKYKTHTTNEESNEDKTEENNLEEQQTIQKKSMKKGLFGNFLGKKDSFVNRNNDLPAESSAHSISEKTPDSHTSHDKEVKTTPPRKESEKTTQSKPDSIETKEHTTQKTETETHLEKNTTDEQKPRRRDGEQATKNINEAGRLMRFGLASPPSQTNNPSNQTEQSKQPKQELSQEFKDNIQTLTPPARPAGRR
jgi:hypothetical protein